MSLLPSGHFEAEGCGQSWWAENCWGPHSSRMPVGYEAAAQRDSKAWGAGACLPPTPEGPVCTWLLCCWACAHT